VRPPSTPTSAPEAPRRSRTAPHPRSTWIGVNRTPGQPGANRTPVDPFEGKPDPVAVEDPSTVEAQPLEVAVEDHEHRGKLRQTSSSTTAAAVDDMQHEA